MRKGMSLAVCAASLLYCSVVLAGPIDNAQQFQQKAARSAAKGTYDKTLKPRGTVITPAKGGFVSPPAETLINTGSTSTPSESGKAVNK